MLKVYSKPDCKWCNILKSYLIENNIPYTNINLADKKNREARKFMSDMGIKDIPIIISGDNIFQGYTTKSKSLFIKDMKKWLKRNV